MYACEEDSPRLHSPACLYPTTWRAVVTWLRTSVTIEDVIDDAANGCPSGSRHDQMPPQVTQKRRSARFDGCHRFRLQSPVCVERDFRHFRHFRRFLSRVFSNWFGLRGPFCHHRIVSVQARHQSQDSPTESKRGTKAKGGRDRSRIRYALDAIEPVRERATSFNEPKIQLAMSRPQFPHARPMALAGLVLQPLPHAGAKRFVRSWLSGARK